MKYQKITQFVTFGFNREYRLIFLQEQASQLVEKIQQKDKENDDKETVIKEEDVLKVSKSIEETVQSLPDKEKQGVMKEVQDLLMARQKELTEAKSLTDQELQQLVDGTLRSLEQFEQRVVSLRKEKIETRLTKMVTEAKDPNIHFSEFHQGQGLVKKDSSGASVWAEITNISSDKKAQKRFHVEDRTHNLKPPIPSGDYSEADLQKLIGENQLMVKESTDINSSVSSTRAEKLMAEQGQLVNELMQFELTDKLKDPAFKKQFTILTTLQKRKADLASEIEQKLQLQAQWEEQNSYTRSLTGGRMRNLLSGRQLNDSPHKKDIERLTGQVAAIEQAISDISSNKKITITGEAIDPVLFQMKNYQDMAATDYDLKKELADQADYMKATFEKGNQAEAGLMFEAMANKYLEHQVNGASFNRQNDGNLSLTGAVNQLIKLGKIDYDGQPVLAARDLDLLKDQIVKNYPAIIQLIDKAQYGGGIYPKNFKPEVPTGLIENEIARLRQIEQTPEMKDLQKPLNQAEDIFEDIKKDPLWKEVSKEIVLLLDDPTTYAMIVAGMMTEGLGTAGVIGEWATKCPKLVGLLSKISKAEKAQQVLRFVLSSALDGAVFHTGLNIFHELSGRGDEANWGVGGYANSMAMFGVGKVVHLGHGKLTEKLPGMMKTGTKMVGEVMVEKQMQTLFNKGLYFSEELLAFGGLGIIQNYLMAGNFNQAISVMKHNFEFLVAMRFVHYGQNKFLVDKELQVRALEKQAQAEPENQEIKEAWIKSYADYVRFLKEAQEGNYRKGLTDKKPQEMKQESGLTDDIRQDGEEFDLTADKDTVKKLAKDENRFLKLVRKIGKASAVKIADYYCSVVGVEALPEAILDYVPVYRAVERQYAGKANSNNEIYFQIGSAQISTQRAFLANHPGEDYVIIKTTIGDLKKVGQIKDLNTNNNKLTLALSDPNGEYSYQIIAQNEVTAGRVEEIGSVSEEGKIDQLHLGDHVSEIDLKTENLDDWAEELEELLTQRIKEEPPKVEDDLVFDLDWDEVAEPLVKEPEPVIVKIDKPKPYVEEILSSASEILKTLGLEQCAEDVMNFDLAFSRIDGTSLRTPMERAIFVEKLISLTPLELEWYKTRPEAPKAGLENFSKDSKEYREYVEKNNDLKDFNAKFVSEKVLPELLTQNLSLEEVVKELHLWQVRGSQAQLEILRSFSFEHGRDIAGVYRNDALMKVSDYVAPDSKDVDGLMDLFSRKFEEHAKEVEAKEMTPQNYEEAVIRLAIWVQQKFLDIHPMRDGNGRASRLLYEYVIRRFLGQDSLYANLPLRRRENGETTIHGDLLNIIRDASMDYYASKAGENPERVSEVVREKLEHENFVDILNDPYILEYERILRGLMAPPQ